MAQKETTFGLMKQWMEINQDLWNNWLNTTQHLGKGPAGVNEAYHEHLKGIENLVNDTIRLERDWVRVAKDQASQTPTLAPVAEYMSNLAETTLDTRSRVWRSFFENAEHVDLSAAGKAMGSLQGPQEFFSSMRAFGEQFVSAQKKAVETTAEAAKTTQEAGAQAAKPTSRSSGQSQSKTTKSAKSG